MNLSSIKSLFIVFLFIVFLFNLILQYAYSTSKSDVEHFVGCIKRKVGHSDFVHIPADPSYSDILHLYKRNKRYEEPTTPTPQLIVTAKHVLHIQAAVLCAKPHGLEMRIRGGGHDYEGLSYVSNANFFILDMFNLRTVTVDMEEKTAWVEAGAILGEVYYNIAEKSSSHAFPGGTCPTVGAAGLIQGGGYGNMARKFGLAADNVVDARLVDVNGSVFDLKSMGEDLFWAITGGSASSFGVVTAYKIKLVSVPPKVTYAVIEMDSNTQNFINIVYKHLQIVHKLNDDIYIILSIFVTKEGGNKRVQARFKILFLGDSEGLLTLMKERFPELGLAKSDCVEGSWVESVLRWNNIKTGTPTSVLLSRAYPTVSWKKSKSGLLQNPIPITGLESIFKKMEELETPILKFFPFGGIMDRISPLAKPFPHRAGNIALVEIETIWNISGAEAADYYVKLTRELYDDITPFLSKSKEGYVNYRDLDLGINHHGENSYEEAKSYGLKYYKNNFEKLVQIKSKWDPFNFFRNEQSIPVKRESIATY